MIEFDPNAPAFGPEAQKVEGTEEPKPAEASVEKPAEEVEREEEPVASVEENKVPYSRFKNVHQRALDAEREAAEWRAQAEILRTQRQTSNQPVESELPPWWVEMYGDSDASKRGWKIQQEQNEALRQQVREEALQAVKEERLEEETRLEKNMETIDGQMESLSELVGRDLTEKEQSAILDIVDSYTPQDEDGNYLGPTIPFERAWEIYELKNQAALAPKKQARDSVANLSGSPSQGETNIGQEKDAEFNPSWGAIGQAIRKKIG